VAARSQSRSPAGRIPRRRLCVRTARARYPGREHRQDFWPANGNRTDELGIGLIDFVGDRLPDVHGPALVSLFVKIGRELLRMSRFGSSISTISPMSATRPYYQSDMQCAGSDAPTSKSPISLVILPLRAQASRRCETQAPLSGKPPSYASVSVPGPLPRAPGTWSQATGRRTAFRSEQRTGNKPKGTLDTKSPIQVRIQSPPAESPRTIGSCLT